MERRGAAIVGIIHVGAGGEQGFNRREATFPVGPAGEADGEIQQRIAIRPALVCQSGIGAQQRFEARDIGGLERGESCHKGFGSGGVGSRREAIHTAGQVVPGVEAVLARIDKSGVVFGEGRLPNFLIGGIGEARMLFANLFQRRRAGRLACAQQTLNPLRDPGNIGDEQTGGAGAG